jgi:hypothetical protein
MILTTFFKHLYSERSMLALNSDVALPEVRDTYSGTPDKKIDGRTSCGNITNENELLA